MLQSPVFGNWWLHKEAIFKRFEPTRYTRYIDDSEMSSNSIYANNFRNVDAIKTQYKIKLPLDKCI
jgi:hypothetical protein